MVGAGELPTRRYIDSKLTVRQCGQLVHGRDIMSNWRDVTLRDATRL